MDRIYTESTSSSYTLTRVFGWMFYAILLTAITAFAVPYGLAYLGEGQFYWPVLVVGMVAVIILSFLGQFIIARSRSKAVAITIFSLFAVAMGVMLSPLVFAYDLKTLTYSLFVTSGVFGIMAVYGAVTKRNLFGFGSFLIMLLFGCIFVSIINIFIGNTVTDWIISYVTLGIYMGFIAFDIWRIKNAGRLGEVSTNLAILMALNLYVDFVYIFIRILAIIGNSKN